MPVLEFVVSLLLLLFFLTGKSIFFMNAWKAMEFSMSKEAYKLAQY